MRIVLVDDDPDLIDVMSLALTQAGHTVTTAEGGVSALSDIRKRPPDLIITDLMMAELDGLEFCREVAKDKSLETKIIMVSARTDALWKDRAHDAGAIGFIDKPIDPMTFADEVERLAHAVE